MDSLRDEFPDPERDVLRFSHWFYDVHRIAQYRVAMATRSSWIGYEARRLLNYLNVRRLQ